MTLHPLPSNPRIFTVLVAAIFLFHRVPTSLSVDDAQYLSCNSTFQCGNISSIGYPFWGHNREPYCGYPGPQFELVCTNETAEIAIEQDTYKILHMDYNNTHLTLARNDYPSDLCLSSVRDTTLNYTTFSYTSDTTNLTFFYNRPTLPPTLRFDLSSSQLSCGNGTGYYVGEDMEGVDLVEAYLEDCEQRVVVPLYDSVAASLNNGTVTMDRVVAAVGNGFGLRWLAEDARCGSCARPGGVCGHSNASDAFTCYCKDKPYPRTCAGTASEEDHEITIGIAIAIAISGGILGGSTGVMCVFMMKRSRADGKIGWKKETDLNETEAFIRNHEYLSTKQFGYSQIKKITNSFSNKLGEGGYGSVYKGTLHDSRLVAVKILKDSKNDNGEFMNEVSSISRTSHVNVVSLLGFCYERDKKALVYEFMPNGSLDRFIYNINGSLDRLEWNILFRIARGTARGLEYLHRGCSTPIVHFDIKPHNILLDKDLVPKISDFGLAKLCTRDESVVSMMGARGTAGYIAPEVFCRHFGGVSHKSDVYSYGMMVLEMVGGRRNICMQGSKTSDVFLPSLIYGQVVSGETLNIEGVGTEEENVIARKMILVSLWCIQIMPESRPSMSKVLEMLEASVESLQIPPMPILTSPPRSPQHSSTISA